MKRTYFDYVPLPDPGGSSSRQIWGSSLGLVGQVKHRDRVTYTQAVIGSGVVLSCGNGATATVGEIDLEAISNAIALPTRPAPRMTTFTATPPYQEGSDSAPEFRPRKMAVTMRP